MVPVMCVIAVLLCSMLCGAQGVSVSGMVTDESGAAVAGAQVGLKAHPYIATQTDVSGAFQLTGLETVWSPHRSIPRIRLSVRGGRLIFSTTGTGRRLTIELFDSRGRTVSGIVLENVAAGTHAVPLSEDRLGQGLYLLKVTMDGKVSRFKTLITGNERFVNGLGPLQSDTVHPIVKQAQADTDTLVVTAEGFAYTEAGIQSYDQQGVEIVMIALRPWIPTGPPERNGGMVKIMANGHTFQMGQPRSDIWGGGTSSTEQPPHAVSFTHDFWMDTTEVTQQEYNSLMSSAYADYLSPVWMVTYGVGDNYPAYSVEWADGALYCNARSLREGYDTVYRYDSIMGDPGYLSELAGLSADVSKNGYRLPTEAEWEYACRGGTATDFYWGKEYDPYPANAADSAEIGTYAVWSVNSWEVITDDYGTQPVGRKEPNAYGLYDMSGNVFEWCHDWWQQRYDAGPAVDPTGPGTGSFRTLRGGSWGNDASYLRSANRSFQAPDYEYYFIGFRVVRTAD